MALSRVENSHGDFRKDDTHLQWSLFEKLQGLVGVSAPIIGGCFGIQIYEYLMFMTDDAPRLNLEWPLVLGCLIYVSIMTLSGFYILLRLERKFGHKQCVESDPNSIPMLVLGVGTMVGVAMMLHRAAFVTIPA